ncbi:hypothetical protein [Salinigranum marinum]|uniref:hypothetical protein n=1 Tax=Salinigranum marinum TaxID=1515595 RepID=UPI002989AB90|nr:hypothetical protein [Salinigranum marinum]
MSNHATGETGDTPITGTVVEQMAKKVDPELSAITNVLLALDVELLGCHATF